MNTRSPCAPHVIPNTGMHEPEGKKSKEIRRITKKAEELKRGRLPKSETQHAGKEGKKSS